jgi:hypothetical protein
VGARIEPEPLNFVDSCAPSGAAKIVRHVAELFDDLGIASAVKRDGRRTETFDK